MAGLVGSAQRPLELGLGLVARGPTRHKGGVPKIRRRCLAVLALPAVAAIAVSPGEAEARTPPGKVSFKAPSLFPGFLLYGVLGSILAQLWLVGTGIVMLRRARVRPSTISP